MLKKKSILDFRGNSFGFDRYLFQLIVLLEHDFNFGNSFALSWVDKVTIRTYNSVSVIVNVETWSATFV